MPGDWWVLKKKEQKRIQIQANRHIPASEPPIEVNSCFGGAAIYKWDTLKELDLETYKGSFVYNGLKRREHGKRFSLCEHVAFHQSLVNQNHNVTIYVQPSFLNNGPGPRRFGLQAPRLRATLFKYWQPIWAKSWNDPNMTQYYETLEDWEK